MPDLVILSPDGAYKQVLPALLKRRQSLGILAVTFDVVSDPFHDASGQIVELLRPYLQSHARALVVRDIEGSGKEAGGAAALEAELKESLVQNGWQAENSAALVLEPEIESWLRLDSAHMEQLIKTYARRSKETLNDWKVIVDAAAESQGGWIQAGKPARPKEVYRQLLSHYGISPSNALLGTLADKESLAGCQVASFNRFREIVRTWFPAL